MGASCWLLCITVGWSRWRSWCFILKLKNVRFCRFVLLGCSISPEKNPPISCLESIHPGLFLGAKQWKEAGSLTFWIWSPFGLVSSQNESFISFWVGEGLSLGSARGGKSTQKSTFSLLFSPSFSAPDITPAFIAPAVADHGDFPVFCIMVCHWHPLPVLGIQLSRVF